MLNRKERMEKMNAMGMDTSKYFTLNVASDIPAGAKIHVIIDKNGNSVQVEKYTEKVKKYEPSYEMPKKAGCITLADKKN